jgi:hypothetical protein
MDAKQRGGIKVSTTSYPKPDVERGREEAEKIRIEIIDRVW